ncbi:MAG: hypothetical protein U0M60_17525 [Clostridia bacterium]|nr:hypothetical protein [Clostridia bacterium]
MKKVVLKLLSFSLVSIILVVILSSGVYAAEMILSAGGGGGGGGSATLDDKASIYVEFDRDEYIAGDTAYAYVYFLGLGPESNAGDILQAYQSYISYDDTKLEFAEGKFLLSSDESGITKTENPVNGNSVIATYLYSQNGIALDDIAYGAEILKLTFNVKASVGETLEIDFDDTYEIEIITKDVEKVYEISGAYGDEVNVIPGEASIVSNLTEYDGDTNTVSSILDVNVTRANGAVLIAKLYNNETGQLVAPVQTKILVKGLNRFGGKSGNELKFNVSDDISKRELEVQYFVWDSITGMKCISKTYTDGVY